MPDPTPGGMTATGATDPITAAPSGVHWNYDDTQIMLIGPHTTRIRETVHRGEHMQTLYKGRKLRALRVIKPLWPDEAHSELVQSWQGEVDGVVIDGMVSGHSNAVTDALIAHVDALPGS
jgi:hypothetical protein